MKKNAKQTLAQANPKLAREWHPTKNAPLTPSDLTRGSNKKVWWICRKGHEWKTVVYLRSKQPQGAGCPYCTGKRAGPDNSLAAVMPGVAREWHPTKNRPLTPNDVLPGSRNKIWWVCREGHEWQTHVYHRKIGCGCPYCSGIRTTKENTLRALHPKIAREWHPTRNAPLTPKERSAKSSKKVWWLCRKGHVWKAGISSRVRGKSCPVCTKRSMCLAVANPGLAREWHPTKNAPLRPKDVSAASRDSAWWICKMGHQWEARISSRNEGHGCRVCARRRARPDTVLNSVKPALAAEWHPTRNGPLTPKDLVPGSSVSVWWKCAKGHVMQERVIYRCKRGGCPVCAEE